jgi:hypothetical protein
MVDTTAAIQKTKVCTTCKEEKLLSEYSPRKDRPLGVHYSCKPCLALRAKEERKRKEYTEEERNVAKIRAAEWRKNNPLRNKEMKANWAILNPHKRRAALAKYEISKQKRTPKWLTKEHYEEIENFYWHAQDLKRVTGYMYHVDHIVPLNGKNVCGLHVPWNLQVLPYDINLSKGGTYHDEYR